MHEQRPESKPGSLSDSVGHSAVDATVNNHHWDQLPQRVRTASVTACAFALGLLIANAKATDEPKWYSKFFSGWSKSADVRRASSGPDAAATKNSRTDENPAPSTADLSGAISMIDQIFPRIADRVMPLVVNISTAQGDPRGAGNPYMDQGDSPDVDDPFSFFFQRYGRQRMNPQGQARTGLGTGFVIKRLDNNDLVIATNNHVVENASAIQVQFGEGDKANTLSAEILGRDPQSDVALLRVSVSQSPSGSSEALNALIPLSWGNSERMRVGQWVAAIGNPLGLGHTLTTGVISASGRHLEGAPFEYFQVDVPINPGNSGGPLVNLNGEVIGITTAMARGAQGIGFVVPSNLTEQVSLALLEHGRVDRGNLGLLARDVTPDIANQVGLDSHTRGAIVVEVKRGSPAARAGLRPGDVVVGVDQVTLQSSADLAREIKSRKPGAQVDLKVISRNTERSLPAVLDNGDNG